MAVADVASASSEPTVSVSTRRAAGRRCRWLTTPGWFRLAAVVLVVGLAVLGRRVGACARLGPGRRHRRRRATTPRRCSSTPRSSTSRWPTPMPQRRPRSSAPGSNPRSCATGTGATSRPRARSWPLHRGRTGLLGRVESGHRPHRRATAGLHRRGRGRRARTTGWAFPRRRGLPAPGLRLDAQLMLPAADGIYEDAARQLYDAYDDGTSTPPPCRRVLAAGAAVLVAPGRRRRSWWRRGRGGSSTSVCSGPRCSWERSGPGRWSPSTRRSGPGPLAAGGLGPAHRPLDGPDPGAAVTQRREPPPDRAGDRDVPAGRTSTRSRPGVGGPTDRVGCSPRDRLAERTGSTARRSSASVEHGPTTWRSTTGCASSTTPASTSRPSIWPSRTRPTRGRGSTRHWTRRSTPPEAGCDANAARGPPARPLAGGSPCRRHRCWRRAPRGRRALGPDQGVPMTPRPDAATADARATSAAAGGRFRGLPPAPRQSATTALDSLDELPQPPTTAAPRRAAEPPDDDRRRREAAVRRRGLDTASYRPDRTRCPRGEMPEGTCMREIQERGRLIVGVDENTLGFSSREPEHRRHRGLRGRHRLRDREAHLRTARPRSHPPGQADDHGREDRTSSGTGTSTSPSAPTP